MGRFSADPAAVAEGLPASMASVPSSAGKVLLHSMDEDVPVAAKLDLLGLMAPARVESRAR